MNYEVERSNKGGTLFVRIKNAPSKKDRYITYNKIMFNLMEDFAAGNSVVAFNERYNGGYIFAKSEAVLKSLLNLLKDKNSGKCITVMEKEKNAFGIKISYSAIDVSDKPNRWRMK